MNRLLINFCAFYLLIPALQLTGQSNLFVIDSLLNQVNSEILSTGKKEIKNNLIVQIVKLEKNKDSYLISKIGNYFKEKNYQVFRNFPKDTSFECTVLEINNCEIYIYYSEPFSKNLFSQSFTNRSIILNIEGQLYNFSDGKVIMPIRTTKIFDDEIMNNRIEQMETSPYVFTYGTKTGFTKWHEYVEPVLVVTSVLTVFILLFTQRS